MIRKLLGWSSERIDTRHESVRREEWREWTLEKKVYVEDMREAERIRGSAR